MKAISEISNILMSSGRTANAVKNIIVSLGVKGVSVIVGLLIVPLTIEYVSSDQYGIWLTLSQIISWVVFFDLGLGNGFRNRFAQAKANGNIELERQYISTTYFAISFVVIFVFICSLIINHFLNWSKVLQVDDIYQSELHIVFNIVLGFFCLNMIANVFNMLLTADQKVGYASVITGIGQIFSLVAIVILKNNTEGSLYHLALYFSGIPCIVTLISTVFAFRFTGYKLIRPRVKDIKIYLVKDILGLGLRFFLICSCMIVIFQISNVVLSRELGPESVTQYNIAYKYFNILYTLSILFITPFWSAYTEAYEKNDFIWMKSTIKHLEYVWMIFVILGIIMLAMASIFYKIWIGDTVKIDFWLSASVFLFFIIQIIGNIYMYLINGIGTIQIQLIVYILSAIIAWPALVLSCRYFGICGITILPAITCLIQAILGKIQLTKLMNRTAYGIWNK